jgi:hypothetical protein
VVSAPGSGPSGVAARGVQSLGPSNALVDSCSNGRLGLILVSSSSVSRVLYSRIRSQAVFAGDPKAAGALVVLEVGLRPALQPIPARHQRIGPGARRVSAPGVLLATGTVRICMSGPPALSHHVQTSHTARRRLVSKRGYRQAGNSSTLDSNGLDRE